MTLKAWRAKASYSGVGAASGILLFIVACLLSLWLFSGEGTLTEVWHDSYYWHVTYFSFKQALYSTLLSVLGALPLALALYRRRFWGRALLIRLFSITLVLPVLVGIFGVVTVLGNKGWLAQWLEHLDLNLPYSIYGLSGILVAHVFFNLPYVARLLLRTLEGIPTQQHQLSLSLGFTPWQKFKWVEWPRLKQQLPHVVGLVFMLCFTSFTTVMVLGGGPQATTIELAIYQAIKLEFDLQTGALLALWQLVLCGGLVYFIHLLSRPIASEASAHFLSRPNYRDSRWIQLGDGVIIIGALLLVAPPLISVIVSGLNSTLLSVVGSKLFWQVTINSMQIALLAATLALTMGYLILKTSCHWRVMGSKSRAAMVEVIGSIILVTPGLVLSTGIFLLLREVSDVYQMALFVVVVVNALMALPLILKNLAQPMLQSELSYRHLYLSLGIRGISKLWWVDICQLRNAFLHCFAVSFLLSLGDFSAIALFGSQDFMTLPLYLYHLMGDYQMDAAAVVALWLLLLSIFIMKLAEPHTESINDSVEY